jgi:hypothetical protein
MSYGRIGKAHFRKLFKITRRRQSMIRKICLLLFLMIGLVVLAGCQKSTYLFPKTCAEIPTPTVSGVCDTDNVGVCYVIVNSKEDAGKIQGVAYEIRYDVTGERPRTETTTSSGRGRETFIHPKNTIGETITVIPKLIQGQVLCNEKAVTLSKADLGTR